MEQLNSTVVPSNISSSPGPPPPYTWYFSSLVAAVVLSFCFLLGVPGNIVVIVLKPNRQHLSSVSQCLMLNLAVSDLLSLLTLPLWIYAILYSWTLGLVACKLLGYLVYCSLYCSLLTVMMLSIQRYLQVVYLQKFLYQEGKKRLLFLLWLVAMILSIPFLVFGQVSTDQPWVQCENLYSSNAQRVAVLLTESLMGFVSFAVVVFAYIRLHRRVNQAAFFNHPQTTRLVTSIIMTFFVLWMPNHITNVLATAAISFNNEGLLTFCENSLTIAKALVFVNNCLNPVLYAFASRNICTVCQKTPKP